MYTRIFTFAINLLIAFNIHYYNYKNFEEKDVIAQKGKKFLE